MSTLTMKKTVDGYEFLKTYYPHLLAKFHLLSYSGIFVSVFGGPEIALRYALATPETLQGVIARSEDFLAFYKANTKSQFTISYTQEQLTEFIETWEIFIQFLTEEIKPVLDKMPEVYEEEVTIEEEVDKKWISFLEDMANEE